MFLHVNFCCVLHSERVMMSCLDFILVNNPKEWKLWQDICLRENQHDYSNVNKQYMGNNMHTLWKYYLPYVEQELLCVIFCSNGENRNSVKCLNKSHPSTMKH